MLQLYQLHWVRTECPLSSHLSALNIFLLWARGTTWIGARLWLFALSQLFVPHKSVSLSVILSLSSQLDINDESLSVLTWNDFLHLSQQLSIENGIYIQFGHQTLFLNIVFLWGVWGHTNKFKQCLALDVWLQLWCIHFD